ncbi:hypothetical protein LZ30DRAFT_765363 [Colletotrichum cereale]|nr:hypothetical protein LZ30DRAFT_765363 [Colletotrichum cereale]
MTPAGKKRRKEGPGRELRYLAEASTSDIALATLVQYPSAQFNIENQWTQHLPRWCLANGSGRRNAFEALGLALVSALLTSTLDLVGPRSDRISLGKRREPFFHFRITMQAITSKHPHLEPRAASPDLTHVAATAPAQTQATNALSTQPAVFGRRCSRGSKLLRLLHLSACTRP